MIRYPLTQTALVDLVNQACPSWWQRSYADTQVAIKSRQHNTARQYWGDVKSVFIRLQGSKCAYCEKPMAQGSFNNIDYDVEHYRPKSSCKIWPTDAAKKRLGIDYVVNSGRSRGYPELAFHLFNYAVACKVCNSPYKSDCFPILGAPNEHDYDAGVLNASERPVIPMPIGDWGEDPSSFLDFEGFIAVAKDQTPAVKRRAQILIDFFELNSRRDILVGRATAIALAYKHLREEVNLDLAISEAQAQEWVSGVQLDTAPFAAAVRAFVRKYEQDKTAAKKIAQLAVQFAVRSDVSLKATLDS